LGVAAEELFHGYIVGTNAVPRDEIHSEDARAVLDHGWRRIVGKAGTAFLLDEAVEFRARLVAAANSRTTSSSCDGAELGD
jgi:hypothetical protein